VGYLVAIVVALVAPLLQGKEGQEGQRQRVSAVSGRTRGREVPVGQAKAADCGKQ